MRLIASLAEHALTATRERTYPPVGRFPDRQAHIIAALLARAYHNLTGREPGYTVPTDTTKSYDRRLIGKVVAGDWGQFIENIFKALGVKRAVTHTVRRGKHGFHRKN